MKLQYHALESLPDLAWCARLQRNEPCVQLMHGRGVETDPRYFVEGIWEGDYAEGRLDEARFLMGSGGRLAGCGIIFSTPCHTLERLHLARREPYLLVSNSLPFLLAAAGASLDLNHPYYRTELWSILHGLDDCVRQIPTRNGPPIELVYYGNLEVDSDLAVRLLPKPAANGWKHYSDYRGELSDVLAALARNSQAHGRRLRYDMLTTISSGYDSTATSALAAEAGCRRALTFRNGIRHYGDRERQDDSGEAIARRLGLDVEEYADPDLHGSSDLTPAEFAACGDAFDFKLRWFERSLRRKILFTGFNGDNVWSRHCPCPGNQLARADPSGTSLGEFRLRVGFLHVPVPFFGATRQPELCAISNSPEMSPWSVGNDYDRPLPRRIVEEKGIPRELFGQFKKGSFDVVQLGWNGRTRVDSFEDYYEKHRGERSSWSRLRSEAGFVLTKAAIRYTREAARLGLPHPARVPGYFEIAIPGRSSFLVQWGNAVLADRYRTACCACTFDDQLRRP